MIRSTVTNYNKNHSSSTTKHKYTKQYLAPHVKRCRIIWLISMLSFGIWFLMSIWGQYRAFSIKQEHLTEKAHQLELLQQEQERLQQYIKNNQSDSYLLEKAHQMGYGHSGECIYTEKQD